MTCRTPGSHLPDRGQVVRQGGTAPGGEFEDAALAKAGVDGVGGAQQLEGGTDAGRGQVVALDLGSANHEDMVFLGGDVEGVARMQQAGRALQGDVGRLDARDLAAHAAQRLPGGAPFALAAQAAAVEHPAALAVLDVQRLLQGQGGVPFDRHAQVPQCLGQGPQQLAVVELGLSRQIEPLVKAPGQGGLQAGDPLAVQG